MPSPSLPPGYDPAPPWRPPQATVWEIAASTAAGLATAVASPLLAGPAAGALGPLRPRRTDQEPAPPASPGGAGDCGWFGPESVAWKVHADASLFVAGIAAFALQAMHPLALAAVADHGSFATDFLGRVGRTGEFVQGVVYGTSAEAERRCADVRRVHRAVVGTAPDGRRYDASDPELLRWVHVGEYLAIAAAYRRFGALPLDDAELDGYIAEVAKVGVAVGVSRPPRDWSSLGADFERFRPYLAVGEQGRAALHFLADPPGLAPAARSAWGLLFAGAMACLPPPALRLTGLDAPTNAAVVSCRCLVRSLGTLLGTPPPLAAARDRLARRHHGAAPGVQPRRGRPGHVTVRT